MDTENTTPSTNDTAGNTEETTGETATVTTPDVATEAVTPELEPTDMPVALEPADVPTEIPAVAASASFLARIKNGGRRFFQRWMEICIIRRVWKRFMQLDRKYKNAAAFVLGVLVTVGGWYGYTNWPLWEGGNSEFPAVVATVNGEKITRDLLEQSLSQTEAVAAAQGVSTTDETIHSLLIEQAMTVIVNTRLLVQAAHEAGFSASDDEITSRLQSLADQFGGEDALQSEAENYGLTMDDLRTDIAEQIVVEKYVDDIASLDSFDVSEDDIQKAYDSVVQSGSTVPPLATVHDAIKTQLQSEKQQEAIANKLEELRNQATIETYVK